jgi:hypothetical protein
MTSARRQADRLGICNLLGLFIMFLAAAAAVMVLVDAAQRGYSDQDLSLQLVHIWGLNRLSIVPSGRALRMQGLQNKAVDWRYDPQLARVQPGPAELVLKARD